MRITSPSNCLGLFTKAFLLLALMCVALLLGYYSSDVVGEQPARHTYQRIAASKAHELDWKNVDPFLHVLPDTSNTIKDVKEWPTSVNVNGLRIHYLEYFPFSSDDASGQHLLLLHGRSFNSATWAKIGTSPLMAALGHHVVAVDLPGFGKTGGDQYSQQGRGEFLASLITSLRLEQPVIVAPSMSGSFAMPFLVTHPNEMSGFVAVAPTATNTVEQDQLKTIKVPTMAVVGSDDDTGLAEQSSVNLRALPHLLEVELSGAGHAAYMVQPQLFNAALYNFMLALRNQTVVA